MSNVEVGRAPDRDGKVKAARAGGLRRHAQGGQLAADGARHARPSTSSRASPPRSSTISCSSSRSTTAPIPAPLNYRGFPKSICTSINHVVCHGIPGPEAAARGRHRQHRRDADRRRLARRHQPHVPRRAHLAPRRAADRRHLRGAAARHRRREARAIPPGTSAPPSRPTPRPSAARSCATSAATASAACSTTAPTSCTTARPAKASSLEPGMLFTIEPMINLGTPAREGAARRLDGGDARPRAVGAVRAHASASPRPAARCSRTRPPGSTARALTR